MKNDFFDIDFNVETGSVASIVSTNDEYKMNWCIEDGGWGFPQYRVPFQGDKAYTLKAFDHNESTCTAVYENDTMQVTVERFFSYNGNYTERYTIKNLRDVDLFIERGAFGITTPFNDIYTYAEDCMTQRCHTHIWCGGNTAYVNALRMGESDINLGLVLTSGALSDYSVKDSRSNHRGIFILNTPQLELLAGQEYVIEWQLFWHQGNANFYTKARTYPTFINVSAPQFTVFENEEICFTVISQIDGEIRILCDDKPVSFEKNANGCTVRFKPERWGEHRFDIFVGDLQTYAEFFVAEELETLLKKRVNFIVDKQQYLREDSPLYGAFLVYDNKEKRPFFDAVPGCHNACKERIGMALLLVKYLQTHDDAKIRGAIDRYLGFVMNEMFDSETGQVFDGIREKTKVKRLYNAPWVARFFTEMYLLTKDSVYLTYVLKILEQYYSVGGERFYPNGFSMKKTIDAFYAAGMQQEAEHVKQLFIAHADNIVKNSTCYPKHEVNFEQTIVSPAVTFISEMACITNNTQYKTEATKHVRILERFSGHQPSFHLYEIPIRYWDDYWGGKAQLFGDTLPHFWACLTASSYKSYSACAEDSAQTYNVAAEQCMRNCLCLFTDKGEGSAAYVYPFKSNGRQGQFYDEWANDQDFALYFYLEKFK